MELDGKILYPSQCNNMYIFPGLGLGSVLCKASQVTDGMLYQASEALASCLDEVDQAKGLVFPSISKIRSVSCHVATEVMRKAVEEGVASSKEVMRLAETDHVANDLKEFVRLRMYQPIYQPLVHVNDSKTTQTWHN